MGNGPYPPGLLIWTDRGLVCPPESLTQLAGCFYCQGSQPVPFCDPTVPKTYDVSFSFCTANTDCSIHQHTQAGLPPAHMTVLVSVGVGSYLAPGLLLQARLASVGAMPCVFDTENVCIQTSVCADAGRCCSSVLSCATACSAVWCVCGHSIPMLFLTRVAANSSCRQSICWIVLQHMPWAVWLWSLAVVWLQWRGNAFTSHKCLAGGFALLVATWCGMRARVSG